MLAGTVITAISEPVGATASVPHFSLPVRTDLRLQRPTLEEPKERVNVARSVTARGSAGGGAGRGREEPRSLHLQAVRGPAGTRLCRAG